MSSRAFASDGVQTVRATRVYGVRKLVTVTTAWSLPPSLGTNH
jgi:hypothetical protein